MCVCVPFIINQTPAAPAPGAALSGLWAIPSTESGPQPLLVTYNLSSLALTPGEPTPYVCMYVSMVHTHMWYVRGYVLGEEGVNASTSRGRNIMALTPSILQLSAAASGKGQLTSKTSAATPRTESI